MTTPEQQYPTGPDAPMRSPSPPPPASGWIEIDSESNFSKNENENDADVESQATGNGMGRDFNSPGTDMKPNVGPHSYLAKPSDSTVNKNNLVDVINNGATNTIMINDHEQKLLAENEKD